MALSRHAKQSAFSYRHIKKPQKAGLLIGTAFAPFMGALVNFFVAFWLSGNRAKIKG